MTFGGDKENTSNRKAEEAEATTGKQSVALFSPEQAHSHVAQKPDVKKSSSWLEALGFLGNSTSNTDAEVIMSPEKKAEKTVEAEKDVSQGKTDVLEHKPQKTAQEEKMTPKENSDNLEPPSFCYSSTVPSVFGGNVVVLNDCAASLKENTVTFRPARAALRSRRHWTQSRPVVKRVFINPILTNSNNENRMVVSPPVPPPALEYESEEEEICEAGQFDCGRSLQGFFRFLFRLP